MKFALFLLSAFLATCSGTPHVCTGNVTYQGLYNDEVEAFLGIRFAKDTSGLNRFKPPRPYVPAAGKTINASSTGPACPQQTGTPFLPLYLGNITGTSEDCLRLNVFRPNGTSPTSKLPVLVWIYGGSFVGASKDDPVAQPGGLILESVAMGSPIIHVAMNYRLGVFGFAQSAALKNEGSENAGLRDQRLAIEWVQKNIAQFGGDPDKVTIHGQSSGGLAVGMQIVAYGGSRPAPFQQGICQSQALEPGITGNFTRDAMARVLAFTGCNTTSQNSPQAIQCLRELSTDQLYEAQSRTYSSDISYNIGDEWLPVVDGDFLPAAPSELIDSGRINNISAMMGWCDNDAVIFTDPTIKTANDTRNFIGAYLPGLSSNHLAKLLHLYPSTDFPSSRFANGSVELAGEVYRAARIVRDIVFTCQTFFLGEALAKAGNQIYYYDQNQTILTPILESDGLYGYGPIHTSELAYMFGNLSHFDTYNFPYHPRQSDYLLKRRESRSWAAFTAFGRPTLAEKHTLQGWEQAAFDDENYGVYVIGGPNEGYSGPSGRKATKEVIEKQRLEDRCRFLNSPEVIRQLAY